MGITKKSYNIITKDGINKPCLWDSNSEALIAMLSLRLEKVRKLNKHKTCSELNYTYLRKRKKRLFTKHNYSPTRLQRVILNEEGY